MKKLFTILIILAFCSVMAFSGMYTGTPDFLPYGLNEIGNPVAPEWESQKTDPNGFQSCFYYDMNRNRHEGRGNPVLKVFYEVGLPYLPPESRSDKVKIDNIQKMLRWLCKSFSRLFKIELPDNWK